AVAIASVLIVRQLRPKRYEPGHAEPNLKKKKSFQEVNRSVIKIYVIVFGLILIVAGCKSTDNSSTSNPAATPAASSTTPASSAGSASSSPTTTATAKSKID